jgi:hypothetical protein
MTTFDDVLKIIECEVGNTEYPANSNKVKYNTEYYGRVVSGSDYPWCCVFCWYVFNKANASNLFYGGKKTASCTTLKNYAIKNGQWVTSNYKPGDLVMMNFDGGKTTKHIGFLVSKNGNTFYTIEGNTSFDEMGSQSNGGAVAKKERDISVIVGAYRPKYDLPKTKKDHVGRQVSITTNELNKGHCGDLVKVLQSSLNALQNSKLVVDGDFGIATETALKKYQETHKNECGFADGVCGKKTWASILS